MPWKFWSTPESIASETPSIMAIVETVAAVGAYWYYAIHFENYAPLIISVAIAPLVLLRSDDSITLGVRWFLAFEAIFPVRAAYPQRLVRTLYHYVPVARRFSDVASFIAMSALAALPAVVLTILTSHRSSLLATSVLFIVYLGITCGMFFFVPAFLIRVTATARHIRKGIECLPANFRRLVFCTSPSELPEIVPGLSATRSELNLRRFWYFWYFVGRKPTGLAWRILGPIAALIIYPPAWLFRFTMKSTVWFWWPIAYLGADRNESRRPELFHWRRRHSLRAKVTYFLAALSIASFLVTNIALAPDLLTGNPLLVVYGYFFLIDWTALYPWQMLSLCMAVISLVILFRMDNLGGEYEYAKTHDSDYLKTVERKFVALEFVVRVRSIFWVLYIVIVGSHIALYLNYRQCLITPAPKVQLWATELYGNRTPPLCGEYRF